jgi:hypothetical protein
MEKRKDRLMAKMEGREPNDLKMVIPYIQDIFPCLSHVIQPGKKIMGYTLHMKELKLLEKDLELL